MIHVFDHEVWSCSSDRNIIVWDAQTGQCKAVLEGHTGRVFGLMVENSLNTFVWSCSWDKMVRQRATDYLKKTKIATNIRSIRYMCGMPSYGNTSRNAKYVNKHWLLTNASAKLTIIIYNEKQEVHKDAVSCLLDVNGTIWSGMR